MKLFLITAFFVTALLYASIGFGGGSTYTALLALSGADYRIIPLVALSCNILVVSANSWRYGREGLIPWGRLWPLLLLSVPCAWLGGRLPISETLFLGLLWAALLLAGIKLLFEKPQDISNSREISVGVMGAIGAVIGFYSGLVGIGGGIFLAPILYMLRWGQAKTIAASCSVFILLNSASGLIGQLMKQDHSIMAQALGYWPLLPAIFIGGFIGNTLGVYKFSDQILKRLTAILILAVAIRVAVKWWGLI